jgi:hypothetical protein
MKRAVLFSASLALASASAFAQAQDPAPSFKDYVDLPKQVVTSDLTFQHQFPKSSYATGTGPKGPATVLIQSVGKEPMRQAVVEPSFAG